MYNATIHGDELTGYGLMLKLIDHLITNYNKDPQITNLINNTEIWINPLANPDGTYRNDTTLKNPYRYNANGIDLNRNFPDPDPTWGPHPDFNQWLIYKFSFVIMYNSKPHVAVFRTSQIFIKQPRFFKTFPRYDNPTRATAGNASNS